MMSIKAGIQGDFFIQRCVTMDGAVTRPRHIKFYYPYSLLDHVSSYLSAHFFLFILFFIFVIIFNFIFLFNYVFLFFTVLFFIFILRYDGPQAGSSAQRSASMEGTGYSSDDTASEDEGEMWNDRRTSDQGEDEEEDMRKRENELKQELNMATLRCEELKRTMIETKSFIDPLHSGIS